MKRFATEVEGESMKLIAMTAIATMALSTAGAAVAQEALAKSSGCLNCHAVDTKKIGPSFKDVAAKYKGKADAEAMLTAKLTAAKEHPAVKASADDVKSLVKWVLSM
jgi:cytochrome c